MTPTTSKKPAISTSTQVCALIGNPISHSLSPAIHNAAFAALALDFVYVAFEVEDLAPAIESMRALKGFRGMSVTMPHKTEAMKYVDEISELDQQIASINTIINQDGRLVALGTDGPAALKTIKDADVELGERNVLMLGSGGVSRAIAFTLAKNAPLASIALMDIDKTLLERLASDLRAGTDTSIRADALSHANLERAMGTADLVINCTPVGMHPNPNACLVPPELLRPRQVVFDVVYNPLETKLISTAKTRGLKTVSGMDMFINQAVMQFERFTGARAPVDVMRGVALDGLES
jgi:shikimate dehydrogenase